MCVGNYTGSDVLFSDHCYPHSSPEKGKGEKCSSNQMTCQVAKPEESIASGREREERLRSVGIHEWLVVQS